MLKIVVTANAFSKNTTLVKELNKSFPEACIVFNTTGRYTREELIDVLKEADAVIVGLDKIDEDVLKKCEKLKIIAKYGVGLDNINIDDCKKYNIHVGWTGGVNKTSVAEVTLGFMLMLCRNLYITSNQLKCGVWNKSGGFQLSNKIIGVIGIGHIGKELIKLLQPFNCKILVNDICDYNEYCSKNNLIKSSKEEIYKYSDVITLHTPYTNQTRDLITLKEMKMMKNSSFLINTARGGIVNENDLKIALKENIISGCAIDTYIIEPPKDEELLSLPNLINTPHIGGNAKEAVEAMGMSAILHIKNFFKDENELDK